MASKAEAKPADKAEEAKASGAAASSPKEKKVRRDVPGSFSYTATPGKFKEALQNIVKADRPDKVSKDFVNTILKITGGSGAPVIPILKRIGFVSSDGTPTDIYARFQSDSGRSLAALEGLRQGFGELFKRNTYVHKLPEQEVKDCLVEITGFKKSDPVVSNIYGTFDAIRSFIKDDIKVDAEKSSHDEKKAEQQVDHSRSLGASLGLSYQINIVLPETTDIAVFNAIFKSLRDNLLTD